MDANPQGSAVNDRSDGQTELDGDDLAAVLAAWGEETLGFVPLDGGAANEHWRAETAEGVRVLRRYDASRAPESLPYEHEVLRFLGERDWPVAAPIPTREGKTVVEAETGHWALFPFMRGDPPPDSDLTLQRKGSVLALLHEDLEEWSSPGQRPGFGRVDDLDTAVRGEGFRSFEDFMAWYADTDSERAEQLAAVRDRNTNALHEGGYHELPNAVGYFECLASNVLFVEDTVTALLDWDMVHEDARVADIARSLVVDCGTQGDKLRSWLAGYAAHANVRLDPDEANLIPPLMVACEIWNTVVPLARWSRSGDEGQLESAQASIDVRLPLYEATHRTLHRAASAAAR